MIYDDAIAQAKGSKTAAPVVMRLATVKQIDSNGNAKIQFFGESSPSSKVYPYLEGYKPTVNDDVLTLQLGSSFIIAGKVSKDPVGDKYYLTKALAESLFLTAEQASELYLTEAEADERYELKGGGGGDIAQLKAGSKTLTLDSSGNITPGGTGYVLGSSSYKLTLYASTCNADKLVGDWYASTTQGAYYLTWATNTVNPSTTDSVSLGSSTKKFANVFATQFQGDLVGKWKKTTGTNSYYLSWNSDTSTYVITPSTTGKVDLGSSSLKFKALYALDAMLTRFIGEWHVNSTSTSQNLKWATVSNKNFVVPSADKVIGLGSSTAMFYEIFTQALVSTWFTGRWAKSNSSGAHYLAWASSTNDPTINPDATAVINLGSSSYQFNNIRAKQFYQNGTAISTSDKRKKKNIKDIGSKFVEFFKKLRPVSFKMKDGDSGRTHTGFIAQEVEEAANSSGIKTDDFAFICIDDNGMYGLRYDELIAIQTKVIQDLLQRVEALEIKVEELSK